MHEDNTMVLYQSSGVFQPFCSCYFKVTVSVSKARDSFTFPRLIRDCVPGALDRTSKMLFVPLLWKVEDRCKKEDWFSKPRKMLNATDVWCNNGGGSWNWVRDVPKQENCVGVSGKHFSLNLFLTLTGMKRPLPFWILNVTLWII